MARKAKFYDNLKGEKKEKIDKPARDSLAIQLLGELSVYSATLPHKCFLAVTLSNIVRLLNAATGSIFAYDQNTNTMSNVVWQGIEGSEIEKFAKQTVAKNMPGLAANCMLERKSILVENPRADPRLATEYFQEIIKKYNLTSAVAMPLIKESKAYGAVVLFSSGDNTFSHEDVEFLKAIIHPVTTAFDAHLYVSQICEERAKLWKIIENLSIGVFITDKIGIIKNCNKTALEILGLEEGMMIDKSVEDVLLPYIYESKNKKLYEKFADVLENIPELSIYSPPKISRRSGEENIRVKLKFIKIDGEWAIIISDGFNATKILNLL